MRRMLLGNTVGENLHNPETDIHDVYLESGSEKAYAGWSATDWIPVTEGRYLIKNDNVNAGNQTTANRYNEIYSAERRRISNFIVGTTPEITETVLKVSSEQKYIRLSYTSEYMKFLEIYRLED